MDCMNADSRHGIYNFVLVTPPSKHLTSNIHIEPAASSCRQHHFFFNYSASNHGLQTSMKYTNSPYSARLAKLQRSRLSVLS